MKKIFLALGLVAASALASCAGGAVDAEKFAEEARKVEDHTYTEAVVKYEYDMDMLIAKDQSKGEIKYTRDETGGWTTESNDEHAEELKSNLETNVRSFDLSQALNEEKVPENVEYDIKYYINPFKITFKVKGSGESEDAQTKVDGKGEFKFEKYGYLTYSLFDMTMEGAAMGATISMKMYQKLVISYK